MESLKNALFQFKLNQRRTKHEENSFQTFGSAVGSHPDRIGRSGAGRLFGHCPYRYDYVSSCAASLNITNRGLATCYGDISLRRGVNAEMTVTLYKSTDKRNWDYVTSWEVSGSSMLSLEKSYYVMSG